MKRTQSDLSRNTLNDFLESSPSPKRKKEFEHSLDCSSDPPSQTADQIFVTDEEFENLINSSACSVEQTQTQRKVDDRGSVEPLGDDFCAFEDEGFLGDYSSDEEERFIGDMPSGGSQNYFFGSQLTQTREQYLGEVLSPILSTSPQRPLSQPNAPTKTQRRAPYSFSPSPGHSPQIGDDEEEEFYPAVTASKVFVIGGSKIVVPSLKGTAQIQSPIPTRNAAMAAPKQYTVQNMWGLPAIVREIYLSRKISNFYDWQVQCIDKLIGKKNIICNLPTGGGKTFIAEIALLRCAILQGKKSLFVLPYVSIVIEKVESMDEFGHKLNFIVSGFYGSEGQIPLPPGNQICIATIEKANAIINQLIEDGRLNEIGCVVVDEIRAEGRGYLLELLLTKIIFLGDSIQIIGMSGTLPNFQQISRWLFAHPFSSTTRPVPNYEYYKVDTQLCDKDGEIVRTYPKKGDTDHLIDLCLEVIPEASVLIFCPTKNGCQATAQLLSKQLPAEQRAVKSSERALLLQRMKAISSRVDEILSTTILTGIAFHHSGLTGPEKELIESGFRERIINVICCTSTLAAGVNLPARRVIIRSLKMGLRNISIQEYKQMAGRAGRAGIDKFGESILLLKPNEIEQGKNLLNGQMEDVKSCLLQSESAFRRLILEAIGGGYAYTENGVIDYLSYSFLAAGPDFERITESVRTGIRYLQDKGFIEVISMEGGVPDDQDDNSKSYEIKVTDFGSATCHSSFSPDEAKVIQQELFRSMEQGIILQDDLHLVYLLTPIFSLPQILDWGLYFKIFTGLSDIRRNIAERIGVSWSFLFGKNSGGSGKDPKKTEEENEIISRTALRFYAALFLDELIKEKPVWQVSAKFKIARGDLESVMQSSASFSRMMVAFCSRIGWNSLSVLLGDYTKRLGFGIRPEIIPLVEIKGVGAARARALYAAGFRNVRAVASARPEDLMQSIPNLKSFGDKVARSIINSARRLLEAKAAELRKEAEDLLTTEKGPQL